MAVRANRERFRGFFLEASRWVVLGAVAALVRFLLGNLGSLELDPNFTLLLMTGLRFADAALHKSGVAVKGITRF